MNVDAEFLKTSGGLAMPSTGLVILTASTTDATFESPTSSAFVVGDDIELKRWDLTLGGWGDGAFQDTTGSLTLSGAWTAGDALRLVWFPTLNLSSTAPGAGTSYGAYRHATGLDGSDPWVTPADGSAISLKFLTSDASILGTGSNLASLGNASFATPVPEPSAYAAAFSLGCLLLGIARRRIKGSAV